MWGTQAVSNESHEGKTMTSAVPRLSAQVRLEGTDQKLFTGGISCPSSLPPTSLASTTITT